MIKILLEELINNKHKIRDATLLVFFYHGNKLIKENTFYYSEKKKKYQRYSSKYDVNLLDAPCDLVIWLYRIEGTIKTNKLNIQKNEDREVYSYQVGTTILKTIIDILTYENYSVSKEDFIYNSEAKNFYIKINSVRTNLTIQNITKDKCFYVVDMYKQIPILKFF